MRLSSWLGQGLYRLCFTHHSCAAAIAYLQPPSTQLSCWEMLLCRRHVVEMLFIYWSPTRPFLHLVRRQPVWTNWGLLVAMVLQFLFLIYSLFSVDAFTLKVQTMVGKDPPQGLPDAFRAGLLAIMAVNAVAAVVAEVLCGYSLKLLARTKVSAWWRRRQSCTDPAMRQGLLGPVLMGSASSSLAGKGYATGALPVHIPTMQPPTGAALL